MTHSEQILAGEERETESGLDLVCGGGEDDEEGSFSWRSCDLCNDHLGGDRYKAALINPGTNDKPIYMDVCPCCMVYIANGDLCDCGKEVTT